MNFEEFAELNSPLRLINRIGSAIANDFELCFSKEGDPIDFFKFFLEKECNCKNICIEYDKLVGGEHRFIIRFKPSDIDWIDSIAIEISSTTDKDSKEIFFDEISWNIETNDNNKDFEKLICFIDSYFNNYREDYPGEKCNLWSTVYNR